MISTLFAILCTLKFMPFIQLCIIPMTTSLLAEEVVNKVVGQHALWV